MEQIVEVECAREYEGKGAMPSYIGNGVIEGFPEVEHPVGLRHVIDSGLIAGLWLWSSGGGWAVCHSCRFASSERRPPPLYLLNDMSSSLP
jgi:hypothetical protein